MQCSAGVCVRSLSQTVSLSLVGNEKWHRYREHKPVLDFPRECYFLVSSAFSPMSRTKAPFLYLWSFTCELSSLLRLPRSLGSPAHSVWVVQHGKDFADAPSNRIPPRQAFHQRQSTWAAKKCILPVICPTQQREMWRYTRLEENMRGPQWNPGVHKPYPRKASFHLSQNPCKCSGGNAGFRNADSGAEGWGEESSVKTVFDKLAWVSVFFWALTQGRMYQLRK